MPDGRRRGVKYTQSRATVRSVVVSHLIVAVPAEKPAAIAGDTM